ncbi:hypothetical protein [Halalkalibacillus halophilus]|uniref:hypothetical protein n=1 Tax=Halalkalibacillus halophilus TaxID=392827 RepID=UPI000428D06E|nr:hypothetical protein [Halalkalibacillus halophilus]
MIKGFLLPILMVTIPYNFISILFSVSVVVVTTLFFVAWRKYKYELHVSKEIDDDKKFD